MSSKYPMVSHMITKSNLVSLPIVFDSFSISASIKFNLWYFFFASFISFLLKSTPKP